MSVLIDTNLLIYLFDQNDPAKQTRAQEVLEYLETSGLGICPMAITITSAAIWKLEPSIGTGLRRPEASGSPSSFWMHSSEATRPFSP